MNHKGKIAMACFMVVALLATLCFGCAEKEEEGKVTITIGHITDMTGPASPAYRAVTFALEDLVRYFNEEDLIPGVKIDIVTYDTGYNPARDIPGYDWCRDRGAKVIYGALPSAVVLKPFAARDEIPIVTLAVSKDMIDPPGWMFAMNAPVSYQVKAFLKWISEEHWDWQTKGPTKIGSAGWEEPYHGEITKAIREYAEAHQEQFDYVGGYLVPMGTPTWAGEVEKLRGCDYVWIPSTGVDTVGFAREFRAKGGRATFIG
ncbi:MAG: ABC transporter substrate-binding protein, partial [Dehalococcoidia bacterium]